MKTGKWTTRVLAFALGISLAGNLFQARIIARQNRAIEIMLNRMDANPPETASPNDIKGPSNLIRDSNRPEF